MQPAVAPRQLANLEPLIRQRVAAILDGLPVGEAFDWVPAVSIQLTTQMLATPSIFLSKIDTLPYWSDVATSGSATGSGKVEAARGGRQMGKNGRLSLAMILSRSWRSPRPSPPWIP